MENAEDILMQLTNFEKSPPDSVPKPLEDYLVYVAKTGNTVFPWPKIKPLFKLKLEKVISEFYQSCPIDDTPQVPNVDQFKFSVIKEKIFEQLESFTGIPFTIQRLCELMTQPKKHYRRTDKFMRGLEKIMLVVSTIEAHPLSGNHASLTMNGDSAGEGPSGHNKYMNNHNNHHALMDQVDHTIHMSPSKRMRMSSPPPEEEAGPCDSADGAAPPCIQEKPELETNLEAQSSSGIIPVNIATPMDDQEAMDIDTECTSSQATIHQETKTEDVESNHTDIDGVESSDESIAPSVKVKERTDSESTAEALSDVDASDLDLDEPEGSEESSQVEDKVSTSEEKAVDEESKSRMAEDEAVDDCSSSDDPVGGEPLVDVGVVEEGACVSQSEGSVTDTPTHMEELDSEATPADTEEITEEEKEVSEGVVEKVETASASDDVSEGGGEEEEEDDDNISVQSSDSSDATTRTDSGENEKEEGAADSSDQVVAAIDPVKEDIEAANEEDSSDDVAKEVDEKLGVSDQQADSAVDNTEDNPSQSNGE